jgi:serine/threonine protein kinase
MSFTTGQVIGDYEVLGELGAGGMGRVYKVRNVLSDRLEAMKELLPGSPASAERFLREIRVLAKLEHRNIAALRTALRFENELLMIMELVEGATLQAMLARGPISMQAAVSCVTQALDALSYAHERGVIHRDIKPANIMLTRDGVVKLMDFGIAKMAMDPALTTGTTTMGSVYYMSPEQISNSGEVDARSDLYSLGVTLYEAVTGSRPFQGESEYSICSAHMNNAPPPPREKNPAVPPELNDAILKALAKTPADRFQTAAEFRSALDRVPLPEQTTASNKLATAVLAPPRPTAVTGPTQTNSPAKLEMAYVLFMDIVAYSTLPMDQQTERIQELAQVVRDTEEFRTAQDHQQLISLPTGDGMALVFFENPTAPVECATEISRALRSHPEIKLRMGVHTGPVYRIPDINTNRNVAGGGINMAQRVMDCGDAGHILVSKTVAEVLGQLSGWAGSFHDLGEAEVKHGVKIGIVNYWTKDVGNPELPQKLRKAAAQQPVPPAAVLSSRKNMWVIAAAAVALIAVAIGVSQIPRHTSSEPKALAAPVTPAASPAQNTAAQPPITPPPTPPSDVSKTAAEPPAPMKPIATKQSNATPSRVATQVKDSQPIPSPDSTQNRQQTTAPSAQTVSPVPEQSARKAEDPQLQALRERMVLLSGRAGGVRRSIANLQRQQNQAGLSLRGDMAAASDSFEYLMTEAKNSLGSGDAGTAKRNLDLAEQQLEKLEQFLGR